jgi:hypothetical protein
MMIIEFLPSYCKYSASRSRAHALVAEASTVGSAPSRSSTSATARIA